MKKLTKILIAAGVGALIAIGITFGIMNKIYKRNLNEIENSYAAQISQVEMTRDSLAAHSDSIDNVLFEYARTLDSLESVDRSHVKEIGRLEEELVSAWNIVFDATEDENYVYLQERYPSEDSLSYPFAGEQVKGIALDIIEGDYKDTLIFQYQQSDTVLRAMLVRGDNVIKTLTIERDDLENVNQKLLDQLAARIEEQRLTAEEAAEYKSKLRKWQAGSLGAVGAGLLLLILL